MRYVLDEAVDDDLPYDAKNLLVLTPTGESHAAEVAIGIAVVTQVGLLTALLRLRGKIDGRASALTTRMVLRDQILRVGIEGDRANIEGDDATGRRSIAVPVAIATALEGTG